MTGEALVIGGGPAGAAVAARLAMAGREVRLFEREAGAHDKVCGEFLSAETLRALEPLGLTPQGLGAVPIRRLRIARGAHDIAIDLPFPAWSLTRKVLDAALLARAEAVGASIARGTRVTGLDRDGDRWRATLAGGEEAVGSAAFLATGKHDLRGWRRPAGRQNDLVGFKQFWRLTPQQQSILDGHVELHTFNAGYAGLQPVEGGRANLCLVIGRRRLAALGGRWDAVLDAVLTESPRLRERFDSAVTLGPTLAIAAIPYGLVRRESTGPWYLGDQAAVIPSLAGDGIAMALAGAERAADAYLAAKNAAHFQTRLGRDLARQAGLATMVSKVITTPPGAAGLMAGLRLWPGLAAILARSTRLDRTRFGDMAVPESCG